MTKTVIWVSGVVASVTIGGALGTVINPYGPAYVIGALGGASAFICARLWLSEARSR